MSYTYIKDIKLALNTCLTFFFSGQQTRAVNGADVTFHDCDMRYGIEKLNDTFTGKPLIIVFSPTEDDEQKLKCNAAFLHRLSLSSRVVVKVGTTNPQLNLAGEIISAKALAHEVWGQLWLVISTQEDRFDSNGIRHISMNSSPAEIDSEESQEVLLTGMFKYEHDLTVKHDVY